MVLWDQGFHIHKNYCHLPILSPHHTSSLLMFIVPHRGSWHYFVNRSLSIPYHIVPEQLDALTADIEEYPAVAMSLTDRLFALLGLSKDISVKKL